MQFLRFGGVFRTWASHRTGSRFSHDRNGAVVSGRGWARGRSRGLFFRRSGGSDRSSANGSLSESSGIVHEQTFHRYLRGSAIGVRRERPRNFAGYSGVPGNGVSVDLERTVSAAEIGIKLNRSRSRVHGDTGLIMAEKSLTNFSAPGSGKSSCALQDWSRLGRCRRVR